MLSSGLYVYVFFYRLTSGAGQLYPLEPNQSILYTWDCPVGKREISWYVDGAQDATWITVKCEKVLVIYTVHIEWYLFYQRPSTLKIEYACT